MAFTIKDPPEFTLEVSQWNRETLADGVEMAKDIEKLLNNDAYNKAQTERAIGKILQNIQIPSSGWTDLSYVIQDEAITRASTVYIGYAFDSIPAAQKANIRGRTEEGKLVLVAKKAPTEDLIVDEVRIMNLKEG